jgi:hypothetical protein
VTDDNNDVFVAVSGSNAVVPGGHCFQGPELPIPVGLNPCEVAITDPVVPACGPDGFSKAILGFDPPSVAAGRSLIEM